jgi:hypothetical protein
MAPGRPVKLLLFVAAETVQRIDEQRSQQHHETQNHKKPKHFFSSLFLGQQ